MVFNFFKKQKTEIYAPMTGRVILLEDVPDPVFSEKMMGEGIAVDPVEGKVYAPIDGKVIQIAPTKHGIGILTENELELLIHIGLDTVNLKGEGFHVYVHEEDMVKKGDLLIEFDLDYVKEHAPSSVTPIVITNSRNSSNTYEFTDEKDAVQGETVLIEIV